MNLRSLLVTASLTSASLLFALPAKADTLLYNQPLDPAGLGFYSYVGHEVIYDDFTPVDSGVANAITWQGSFDTTAETTFTINVYDGTVGQAPGARILSQSVTPVATDTGYNQYGFEIYSYTASIDPLSLDSSDLYWISILGTDDDTDWLWWTSTSGDSLYYAQSGSLNQNSGYDFAFQIAQSTTTPEPSGLMLLGTGLVGSATLLRRRYA